MRGGGDGEEESAFRGGWRWWRRRRRSCGCGLVGRRHGAPGESARDAIGLLSADGFPYGDLGVHVGRSVGGRAGANGRGACAGAGVGGVVDGG